MNTTRISPTRSSVASSRWGVCPQMFPCISSLLSPAELELLSAEQFLKDVNSAMESGIVLSDREAEAAVRLRDSGSRLNAGHVLPEWQG